MALLFDLYATQPHGSTFHGGGEYGKAVFAAIAEAAPHSVVAAHRPDRWLDPAVEDVASRAGIPLVTFESREELESLVRRPEITSFYSALPYDYGGLDVASVHFAFTIHGLRPIERPTDAFEGRYRKRAKAKATAKRAFPRWYRAKQVARYGSLLQTPARSQTVFVPSHHTKYALLVEFPELGASDIHIVYSPRKPVGEPKGGGEEFVFERLGVSPGEYILVLSGDRWVKNGIRAARALDLLYERFGDAIPDALVLGVTDSSVYERGLRNVDRFNFSGYVDTADLDTLYAEAFALLYPTLNEGFGYPPLEAMQHGTPVVCAAVASTTEVCRDSVLYVDPMSEGEMSNRLLQLCSDPEVYQRYQAAGVQRAAEVGREQDRMLESMVTRLVELSRPDGER